MTPLAATLVAALLGAGGPGNGSDPGTPDGGAPSHDPDAQVIENLELLEGLDLLENLDLLEPQKADPPETKKADAPPEPAPAR